jgi:Nucleotide-diphospho-sugar transferase
VQSSTGAVPIQSQQQQQQQQSASSTTRQLFPDTMEKMFAGSATVPREDFIRQYDIGVPWDEPIRGAKDVLLLYSSLGLPKDHVERGGVTGMVAYKSAQEATSNCTTLKVVLTEPKQPNVCLAIVPQWDSFNVHHFMRLKPDNDVSMDPYIDMKYPFRYVSRRDEVSGKGIKTSPQFPEGYQTRRYWTMLIDYLQKLEATTARLKPLAAKAAGKDNTVIVMVCNFGQSELLFNFVCSARARGLDLSSVLLFATDDDTTALAQSLGLAVFDVGDAFGTMPKTAAKSYGDRSFREMMLSKVYCVHLINALGYDLLFQDVDVVWRRNAVEFFHSKESGDFDFYFQDGKLNFSTVLMHRNTKLYV